MKFKLDSRTKQEKERVTRFLNSCAMLKLEFAKFRPDITYDYLLIDGKELKFVIPEYHVANCHNLLKNHEFGILIMSSHKFSYENWLYLCDGNEEYANHIIEKDLAILIIQYTEEAYKVINIIDWDM